MSDLAPFVAATIRDKVFEELKKEHDQLKKTVDESLRVQVKGDYSSNDRATVFQEGRLGVELIHDNTQWYVDLNYEGKQFPQCTIRQLLNATITVGGVKLETLGEHSQVTVLRVPDDDDGVMKVEFDVGCCKMYVAVHGRPVEEQDRGFVEFDGWEFLYDMSDDPEMTVIFHWLTIDVGAVEGLFQRLPGNTATNEDDMEVSNE